MKKMFVMVRNSMPKALGAIFIAVVSGVIKDWAVVKAQNYSLKSILSAFLKLLIIPMPLWIVVILLLGTYIIYRVLLNRQKTEMPEIIVSQDTEMNPEVKSLNEDMINFIGKCITASEKGLKTLIEMNSVQLVDEMNKQLEKKEILDYMNPQLARWMNSKTYFDNNSKFRTTSVTFIRDNIKRLINRRIKSGMF